jgi:hypothetical protein
MPRDVVISLALLALGGVAALVAHVAASRREARRDQVVDKVVEEILRDPHQNDEDTQLLDSGRRYGDGT